MFDVFVKKINALSIRYLIAMVVFCFLAFSLGIISFIYDIVLPGFMLGEKISGNDVVYSLIDIVVSGCLSIFLIRCISKKRKGSLE